MKEEYKNAKRCNCTGVGTDEFGNPKLGKRVQEQDYSSKSVNQAPIGAEDRRDKLTELGSLLMMFSSKKYL